MSQQPFAELICTYLDGLPGAADILNDALEESGKPRLAVEGTMGERLALVLEQLLEEPLARRASVDFARHVVEHCDSPFARAVLDQKNAQVDPDADEAALKSAAEKVAEFEDERFPSNYMLLNRLGWRSEASAKSSAAWALWGALQIPVHYVSLAAQRISTTELQWQVEHLKQLLSNTTSSD